MARGKQQACAQSLKKPAPPKRSRSHFFAVSATIMRRILVDYARSNRTKKRGDGGTQITLNDALLPAPEREPEILALDEALEKLAKLDKRQSKIVELR